MERKEIFFEELQKNLMEKSYDQILLMGDFNGVVNTKLDKQLPKDDKYMTSLPMSFFDLPVKEDLIDSWRLFKGVSKIFTFHSGRYDTDSRIDMIWISRLLGTLLKEVDVHPKIFSDHNPIEIQIKKLGKSFRWRVNETVLENPENVEELKKETTFYFQSNKTQDVSEQIVWDAYKAVIRGKLMAINSKEKKSKNEKNLKLENEIMEKEVRLNKFPKKQ